MYGGGGDFTGCMIRTWLEVVGFSLVGGGSFWGGMEGCDRIKGVFVGGDVEDGVCLKISRHV